MQSNPAPDISPAKSNIFFAIQTGSCAAKLHRPSGNLVKQPLKSGDIVGHTLKQIKSPGGLKLEVTDPKGRKHGVIFAGGKKTVAYIGPPFKSKNSSVIKPDNCAGQITSNAVLSVYKKAPGYASNQLDTLLPTGINKRPFTQKEITLKMQLVRQAQQGHAVSLLEKGKDALKAAGKTTKTYMQKAAAAPKETALVVGSVAIAAHTAKTIIKLWPNEAYRKKYVADTLCVRHKSRRYQPDLSYRKQDSINSGDFGVIGLPSIGW